MSQYRGTCYATDADALAAMAVDATGSVVSAGGVAYSVGAVPVAPSSLQYTLTPVGGSGSVVTTTVAVSIPNCMLLDWADGLAIGWGIAGVWILTYAVLFLRKAPHE